MSTRTWPADGYEGGESSDWDEALDELLEQWEAARRAGRPVRLEELCDDPDLLRRARSHIKATLAFEQFRREGASPPPHAADPPSRIGLYEVLEWINCGASCDVFHCRHTELGRHAAVKVYKPTAWPEWNLSQCQSEIKHLVSLNHDGIVHIYDAGTLVHDGTARPWFAMELVQGTELKHYLEDWSSKKPHARSLFRASDSDSTTDRRSRPERPTGKRLSHLLRIFLDLCDAVAYAHRTGIVHCDLKFQNILVDESDRVKVIDFGIGMLHDVATGDMLQPIRAAGTPPYMAPERFSDPSTARDVRSDVYSLGVVLYRMLTGRYPYDVRGGSFAAWKKATAECELEPPSRYDRRIDADLEAVILKSIATDRSQRYQSVERLAEDIRRYRDGWPVGARPIGPFSQLSRWARRNRAFATLATVAMFALIATTTAAVFYGRQATRRANRLERITELARASGKEAVRYSRQLERAKGDLSHQVERLRYSTTNMALWQASTNFESEPQMARALLLDPELCAPEARGFVWKLLERQTRTALGSVLAHQGRVYRLALSADGKTLLTSGADGFLKTWKLPHLEKIAEYRAKIDPSSDIALSPTGSHALLINRDGDAVYVDLAQNRHQYLLRTPRIAAVTGAFCPRTGRVAVADRSGMVRVWNTDRIEVIDRWQLDMPVIVAIQFGVDGMLGAVTQDGRIYLRDVDAKAEIARDSMPLKMIQRATWDRNLRYVLAVRSFRRLLVWDRSDERIVEDGVRHSPLANSIVDGGLTGDKPPRAITADHFAVTIGAAGRRIFIARDGEHVSALAVSPSSGVAVVGTDAGAVHVEAIRPPPVEHHVRLGDAPLRVVAFDRQRRRVFAGIPTPPTIYVCNYQGNDADKISYPKEERLVELIPFAGSVAAISQTEDGTVLLRSPAGSSVPKVIGSLAHRLTVDGFASAGDGESWIAITRSGALVKWDRSWQFLSETPRMNRSFRSIAAVPNQPLVAANTDRGIVNLIDPGRLEVVQADATRPLGGDLAWSPTAGLLAAAGGQGLVQLLRLPDLEPTRRLRMHSERVTTLAFSPDGKLLATAGSDGQVILWDTNLWEPRCRLQLGPTPLMSVAFSPDGTCLVAGDRTGRLTLWDTSE